jgi:microcystin degradation protein MlrC
MPRIALGGFLHETNTFSPIPTTFESFASRSALLCGIYQGKELEKVFRGKIFNNSICGFYAEADKHGFDIVPIAKIGEAEPSGTIPRDLFYQLLGLITQGLQDQGPFDGVYLDLHGAMVYAPKRGRRDRNPAKSARCGGGYPGGSVIGPARQYLAEVLR